MIKPILRTFIFLIISTKVAEYVMDPFIFGGNEVKTFLLFIFALTLLYQFLKPVLKVVSLPTDGVGFMFISFVMTLIILQVLMIFIPDFGVKPTTISDLVVFGVLLPAKSLTKLWSAIFSSLLIGLVFTFFEWLCSRK